MALTSKVVGALLSVVSSCHLPLRTASVENRLCTKPAHGQLKNTIASHASDPREISKNWTIINVQNVGIKPGNSDVSAKLRALVVKSADNTILFFPRGKYTFSRPVQIDRSNIVIRGQSSLDTTFMIQNSMEDLFGVKRSSPNQSDWSFGPGLFQITGSYKELNHPVAVEPARKGSREVYLNDVIENPFTAATFIYLSLGCTNETEKSELMQELLGVPTADVTRLMCSKDMAKVVLDVESKLKRGFRLNNDLNVHLNGQFVHSIIAEAKSIHHIGIENISFEFPWSPYPGHFKEKGYNAISADKASGIWLRQLRIINSDFGIRLSDIDHSLISDVGFLTTRGRSALNNNYEGHHGIALGRSQRNLIRNVRFEEEFVHDVAVESFSNENLFYGIQGRNLNLDFHRMAPFRNIFENIDFGKADRPFMSGGTPGLGLHTGVENVYVNLHGDIKIEIPNDPDFSSGDYCFLGSPAS